MKATVAAEKVDIGLSDKQRNGVVEILNNTLADLHVLYVKTRNYHWNVTGIQFRDFHKLLEDQYDQLSEAIDEVAERVRQLGAPAPGSMQEYLKRARLKEDSGTPPDAMTMIANLRDDHEAAIRQLRADADACDSQFNDSGTNDFLIGLMQQHEKTAWMLRAILE